MSKPFYISAAIPYINGTPHLGHVFEWFQADSVARYQRSLGKEVIFSCGTDENSLKNVQAAEKAGTTTQAWLDEYSAVYQRAFERFNISLTHFNRGSDAERHWPGVQELWRRCKAAGDIYTKEYSGKYCVGCEAYYTNDELVDGRCPEHLTEPETITETNYFFKLSNYQDRILEAIESNSLRIISDQYRREMIGFIKQGLEDFSISRSIARSRGVGVPVPGDDTQVMYVWFDALAIYLTSIGWGYDQEQFDRIWPADVHYIGKGIARFHAVYWIGMLLSAGLELPRAISIHGYISADGQKMSKSLGNVIDPFEVADQYGLEPIRYYLLKHIPSHTDGDVSIASFKEVYTADLANGIGNLCSRVATLAAKAQLSLPENDREAPQHYDAAFQDYLSAFQVNEALNYVSELVRTADQYLSEHKPWLDIQSAEARAAITQTVSAVIHIAHHLQPFLPETAAKILTHFCQSTITTITNPLFPRLEKE